MASIAYVFYTIQLLFICTPCFKKLSPFTFLINSCDTPTDFNKIWQAPFGGNVYNFYKVVHLTFELILPCKIRNSSAVYNSMTMLECHLFNMFNVVIKKHRTSNATASSGMAQFLIFWQIIPLSIYKNLRGYGNYTILQNCALFDWGSLHSNTLLLLKIWTADLLMEYLQTVWSP